MWIEADVQECSDKKGRAPIGVRWVEVDKGFGVHRSRLVAKDFRPKSRVNEKERLFAATPPLELVKMLIMWTSEKSQQRQEKEGDCSWISAMRISMHLFRKRSSLHCRRMDKGR